MNRAIRGLASQDNVNNPADGANIGCAVTSGSNPNRRSRSVGAFRDSAKEHRMSPIQWRQWRRRSDEIKYWRESKDGASLVLGQTTSIDTELRRSPVLPPEHDSAKNDTGALGNDPAVADNPEGFNFELASNVMQPQEHVALEERVVTLEIKSMDFEYAISKLQASLSSKVTRRSDQSRRPDVWSSGESQRSEEPTSPQYGAGRPSEESYATSSGRSAEIESQPPGVPDRFQPSQSHSTVQSDLRPTSVATTLKAGPDERRSLLGGTSLTIEHYSTLISLIRREQTARMRLEDQVSVLQQQVQFLSQRFTHPREYSRRQASPESDPRRRYHSRRGRSSNFSDETDTDDASFHDVYVTPVERGEFERQELSAEEEGVAF